MSNRKSNTTSRSNVKAPKYSVIYCDPPWHYKARGMFNKGINHSSASKIYKTIKTDKLKTFPMKDIMARNSLLFMWVTSPLLADGIELIKAWGLKFATVGFVWNKVRKTPGSYTVSQCELVLIAKNGKIPVNRGARNIRQYLEETRTDHSRKPSEIRDRIKKMFPRHKKVELFARQRCQGWDAWGNEVRSNRNLTKYLRTKGW